MISSVTGPILSACEDSLVIGIGGVGLKVEASPKTVVASQNTASLAGEVTLYTTLVVREDSLTLFGFSDVEQQRAFDVLLGITGIGPRLAQAALDVLGVDALRDAVANDDLVTLAKIPGVGKKTAQRMTIEIGDKLGAASATSASPRVDQGELAMREAVEAGLEQLGWPRAVATRVVGSLEGNFNSTEAMLRAALGSIGAGRG